MRVAVVGGGVIGLCLAEALSRRGAEVVLIENAECGCAASAGNGGWVTPGLASPIPAPGTMGQAIRWMLNPRSPLRVRPVLRPSFVRWNYDFWRSTKPRRFSAGMAAMMALGRRILDDYDALAGRCTFEMHSEGLLFVGRRQRTLHGQARMLGECRALGYEGEVEVMGRAEVLAREPALEGELAGGVYAHGERHVRPETLSAGVLAEIRRRGVEVREQTQVTAVVPRASGFSLLTPVDRIAADRVVLAAGVATRTLLAPLGVRLPVESAKGYSLTVEESPRRVRESIYMLEDRVGVTPFERGMRLGGTLELGARGLALSKGRLAAMERAARRTLGEWTADVEWRRWAGFRSLLPDGLPVIGPVPGLDGLHVATGHGMVGVTLAPTTAEVLAPAVVDGGPELQLAPFSIARFDNRGHVVAQPPEPERNPDVAPPPLADSQRR